MKKMIVGGLGAAVGYYLTMRFVIKASPDGPGFIEISEGFGPDDIALGMIPFFVGMTVAKMV